MDIIIYNDNKDDIDNSYKYYSLEDYILCYNLSSNYY